MGILRLTNGCHVVIHRYKRILWLVYSISGLDLYMGYGIVVFLDCISTTCITNTCPQWTALMGIWKPQTACETDISSNRDWQVCGAPATNYGSFICLMRFTLHQKRKLNNVITVYLEQTHHVERRSRHVDHWNIQHGVCSGQAFNKIVSILKKRRFCIDL